MLVWTICEGRIEVRCKHKGSIHSSIFYTRLIHQSGRGSLSQLSLGERRGTPWTDCQSITRPHRDKWERTILETPINLTCMFLDGGRTWREPTHTQGEHANSTQKGPSRELNLEPSCCEATLLTTTPPCSPPQGIYPSIHFLYRQSVGRVVGGLEPIPAIIGRKAGYTLDRSPVHHRAT